MTGDHQLLHEYLEKMVSEIKGNVEETRSSVEWIRTQLELLKLKVAIAGAIGGAVASVIVAIISRKLGG